MASRWLLSSSNVSGSVLPLSNVGFGGRSVTVSLCSGTRQSTSMSKRRGSHGSLFADAGGGVTFGPYAS